MNIALPAIVVFFLILPGFIVRARFKLTQNESLDYSPFGQVVVQALILAGFLYVLWLCGSSILFDKSLNWNTLLHLLASHPEAQSDAITEAAKDINWVAWYFGSLILVCFVLPPFVRQKIVHHRLDRFIPENSEGNDTTCCSRLRRHLANILRFRDAPWYYLLSGADEEKKPEGIYVSAIVHVGSRAILYYGLLDDYILDSHGQLDRFILRNVLRWNLKEYDSTSDEVTRNALAFYIPGDLIVLRYNDTVTVSIDYFYKADLNTVTSSPNLPENNED